MIFFFLVLAYLLIGFIGALAWTQKGEIERFERILKGFDRRFDDEAKARRDAFSALNERYFGKPEFPTPLMPADKPFVPFRKEEK